MVVDPQKIKGILTDLERRGTTLRVCLVANRWRFVALGALFLVGLFGGLYLRGRL